MVKVINGSRDEEIHKIKQVKLRCQSMLQEALSQILSQTLKGKFEDLPFLHLMENDISLMENQYRRISLVEWCEEECFAEGGIPKESLLFWQGVAKHNNFKEFSTYALTSIITPASNAIVERIFSLVTAVKTKPRNRTEIKLLDAIIRIRSHLLDKICCKDFKCTANMIKLHNSENLYSKKSTIDNETNYLEEILQ